VKYRFIDDHKDVYRVRSLCAALGVSRGGYYEWRDRRPSRRTEDNMRLLSRIQDVHRASRENYGAYKTWKVLRAEGESCGRHRVARLRQAHGIVAKRVLLFRRAYANRNSGPPAPNLLDRHFTAERPNRVWVTDITFVPTRCGWLYLAVMIDLYSRRIVGWSMSNRNDQQLAVDTLQMAIQQRRPESGLIHHSDQGQLYAGAAYRAMLRDNGIVQSMSRKGNCLDNAVAESFFSNLKNELVHHVVYEDRDQARSAIFEYLELFYNRQRLHQSLDYISPANYEAMASVA
jgi:transposase InsO family protein